MSKIQRLSGAKLPSSYGHFTVFAYGEADATVSHLALLADPIGKTPLVRIHSECLTGDVFGSLRCDCGTQVDLALSRIAKEGGVLIYLRQEGRGIGLANKIKAYSLQDDGMDTVDANNVLGFEADPRDYEVACEMLCDLGIEEVRLLTNNPQKIRSLTACGIEVVERMPLVTMANSFNSRYLSTKRDRLGHFLP